VSTSGWRSGLVALECANAQNSYCELLGGYQETNPGGCCTKVGGYNPLSRCRKLSGVSAVSGGTGRRSVVKFTPVSA